MTLIGMALHTPGCSTATCDMDTNQSAPQINERTAGATRKSVDAVRQPPRRGRPRVGANHIREPTIPQRRSSWRSNGTKSTVHAARICGRSTKCNTRYTARICGRSTGCRMTLLSALELHPYLEWADTLEMWKINEGNCCLCANSRLRPDEKASRGGISAMLCPSCIAQAIRHGGTIPTHAALSIRDEVDKKSAKLRERMVDVVVGHNEDNHEEKTKTTSWVTAILPWPEPSSLRSARGHFSFPVDMGLLEAVRWGHPTARCMGRDRELSTVQC